MSRTVVVLFCVRNLELAADLQTGGDQREAGPGQGLESQGEKGFDQGHQAGSVDLLVGTTGLGRLHVARLFLVVASRLQ